MHFLAMEAYPANNRSAPQKCLWGAWQKTTTSDSQPLTVVRLLERLHAKPSNTGLVSKTNLQNQDTLTRRLKVCA